MEVIDATSRITVKGKAPVKIMPLGDIQFGTPDTWVSGLKEWVKRGLDEGCYFIGMGDYLDFMSPSNRQRITAAALYDNSQNAIDEYVHEQVREVYSILRPTAGKWLGLLHGHHYWTYMDGTTSDQELAYMLNAPYLGTTAMVGLTFKTKDVDGTCVIWATHGSGGGASYGAPLNKLSKIVETFDAHIYLIGHMTKLAGAKPQRIVVNWETGEVSFVNLVIACTGGFMQGYTPGRKLGNRPEGSYVEHKMLPPVGLGASMVTITPRTNHGIFAPDVTLTI